MKSARYRNRRVLKIDFFHAKYIFCWATCFQVNLTALQINQQLTHHSILRFSLEVQFNNPKPCKQKQAHELLYNANRL